MCVYTYSNYECTNKIVTTVLGRSVGMERREVSSMAEWVLQRTGI